jgi:hypothetical protein
MNRGERRREARRLPRALLPLYTGNLERQTEKVMGELRILRLAYAVAINRLGGEIIITEDEVREMGTADRAILSDQLPDGSWRFWLGGTIRR